jgi:hypothetical protein
MSAEFAPVVPISDQADRGPTRFKWGGIIGIVAGVAAMFTGSAISRQGPEIFLAGSSIFFAGWSLLVLGCVYLLRWKGYSGWLGLLGYLLLPGLIVVVCLPNRRRRLNGQSPWQEKPEARVGAGGEALARTDRNSGIRYALTLIPLALLFTGLVTLVVSVRANVDTSQWQSVAHPDDEFAVLMPGAPEVSKTVVQETPTGNVELHKYSVVPQGRKELYMVVVNRFPEDLASSLGGADGLLNLGRKDVLEGTGGRLNSEHPIELVGCPGLELEVLPPKGAVAKCRVYAARNALYQV